MFEDIEEVGNGVFRYQLVGWKLDNDNHRARCVVTVDGGASERLTVATFEAFAPHIQDAVGEVERWARVFIGMSTTRRQELIAAEPAIYEEGKAHVTGAARRAVIR